MSNCNPEFKLGQRVYSSNDTRRIGTLKYVGEVHGNSGIWVGVDWDDGNAKHDGSLNGVRYFQARSEKSGSFIRVQNLSLGISLPEALEVRYRSESSKEEKDEIYVLSASNQRVSVELVGKDKIQDKLSKFEELTSASLSYLGVSSPGVNIGTIVPILKELDLTKSLLSDWKLCHPFVWMLCLDYDLLDGEQAIVALWKYSLGGKNCVDKVMQFSGCINHTINLLKSESSATCEAAARLLLSISSTNVDRDSVAESGAIEEITGLLSRPSLTSEVKKQIICALWNLSADEKLKLKIANADILTCLSLWKMGTLK